MLDGLTVPAWIAHIIDQLAGAPFTELSFVLINAEPPAPEPRFARLRGPRRQRLLFNLYRRLDARLFRAEPDAFAPVSIEADLVGVPQLAVRPLRPKPFEHRFETDVIAQLRAADLDVLLRFGFNIIRGQILDCARFGVWSYHHGDNREYRGTPDFFWEMYEGNPVSGTLLQVLTDELDAGKVLYRSYSATDPASYHRGRNPAYWKTAQFVLRRLRDLHEWGWEQLAGTDDYRLPTPYEKGIYRTPNNQQMVGFLARLLAGILWRRIQCQLFHERWYVAHRHVSDAGVTGPGVPAVLAAGQKPRGFRRVSSPTHRWYADPFGVEHAGAHHLFFEDADLASGKGIISYARLDGGRVQAEPVLERPYHLSYPFVFRADGEWYMLPESRDNRSVELYRATEFPWRWALERTVLSDLDAVDPTLLEHDGRFWLFVNVAVPRASIQDELCLYCADSLHGEWTPHPSNPIVSDVRRARPAGRIIQGPGGIIRPSQDCSQRYGGAIVFNRITTLTETAYAEEPIGRLEMGWRRGNRATHTFNQAGDYELIDAQRRTLKAVDWVRARAGR